MQIKVNFFENGKNRGLGKIRSLFDFFFPIGKDIIRFEAGTFVEKKKGQPVRVILREFGTFRAFFWHFYFELINLFKQLLTVRVYVFQIATVGGMKMPFGYSFAIAIDTVTDSDTKENTDPWTWSHTSTGSNLTAVIGFHWWDNGGVVSISGVSYNSVGMTLVDTQKANGYVYNSSIYYLTSPATGANNASVDFNSGSYGIAGMVTLSGTDTASPIDVSGKSQNSSTTISTSVTTNYANSYLIDHVSVPDSSAAPSPDGGQTSNWTSATRPSGGSRKATTAAGSYSMGWTANLSGRNGHVVVAIKQGITVVTRTPSDSIMIGASRTISLARTYASIRAKSDAIMSAASRAISVAQLRAYTRAISDSVMNAASRVATLGTGVYRSLTDTFSISASIDFVVAFARNISLSIMNAASRTISLSRAGVFTRTAADSVMNAAGRLATVARGIYADLSDSFMNAASRLATVARAVTTTRAMSLYIMNAASRLISLSKVKKLIRAASDTVLSMSDSLARQVTKIRAMSDSIMIAAGRTISRFQAFLNGLLVGWGNKFTDQGTTYTNKFSDQNTDWKEKF